MRKHFIRNIIGLLFLLPGVAGWAGLINGHDFSDKQKAWWAVQPVRDPAVPGEGTGWARNAIDRFIARTHKQGKLSPAKEADRYELVRRAYFDLHGLPPTPGQIDAFVKDQRPDAWERLIDELLASPRYGEQWAQHWLDVVRYAETDGYRADFFRPGAYHYRDYVIRSFNADKPYDQFVREQLAADEMGITDPKTLIATAFLRHGIYEYNQRNARMHWELIVDEMTRVTGEAFLGLGVGCAQCHDHKFDPILQKDYYALQSFLSTTAWPTDRKLATPEQMAEVEARQAEWEEATALIREEMDEMLAPQIESKSDYAVKQFPEEIQEMYNKSAAVRTPYEQQMADLVQRQVDDQVKNVTGKSALKGKEEALKRFEALEAALKDFENLKPKSLPEAFIAADVGPAPVPTYISSRTGREEVQPAYLTLLGQGTPNIQPLANSTGRRRALAEWITHPDNMLSTRVAANRIWQHHFGRGIVATPNDFGMLGEPPSHPELLDWLARRFVSKGWKLKPMHRLIMNSAVYRQTARREPPEVAAKTDPGNTRLWRYPPRRLSAEQIRDAMLLVSGSLQHRDGGASQDGSSTIRSVYVTKRRNSPDAVLAAFDAPQGFQSAPTRQHTATPTQSLLLSNNAWPLARASGLAAKLMKGKAALEPAVIDRAYRAAFGRPASKDEVEAGLRFVQAQAEVIKKLPAPELESNAGGFEPMAKSFKAATSFGLGKDALRLHRSGAFRQVDVKNSDWLDDHFTIEAVTQLDSVYSNADVNTLVSRWAGKQNESAGWTFGITSERSAYEKRNIIMQLVGEDVAGNLSYEVIDSNLQMPLKTPLYLAAVVNLSPGKQGTVTFYAKDLSTPQSPVQVSVVKHRMVRGIQDPDTRLLIGGRDEGTRHSWDGPVGRLTISDRTLAPEELLVFDGEAKVPRVFDFTFDATTKHPVSGGAWRLEPEVAGGADKAPKHLAAAMTDFCHALLISNEFLYLH